MFKHLKGEKGEALLIFLIGIVFTFTVAAVEANSLKAELKECQTPQAVSISLSR